MNNHDEISKDDESISDISMEIIIAIHQAATVNEKVNARKETLISKYLKSIGI